MPALRARAGSAVTAAAVAREASVHLIELAEHLPTRVYDDMCVIDQAGIEV